MYCFSYPFLYILLHFTYFAGVQIRCSVVLFNRFKQPNLFTNDQVRMYVDNKTKFARRLWTAKSHTRPKQSAKHSQNTAQTWLCRWFKWIAMHGDIASGQDLFPHKLPCPSPHKSKSIRSARKTRFRSLLWRVLLHSIYCHAPQLNALFLIRHSPWDSRSWPMSSPC